MKFNGQDIGKIMFNGQQVTKAMLNGAQIFGGPRIVVKDTFTRADSATTLGNADTGQTWETISGVFGISGNAACVIGDSSSYNAAVIDSGISDGIIKCTFINPPAQWQYLIFRVTDNNNYLNIAVMPGSYKLRKRVNGEATILGTYSTAAASGDVIEAVLSGSSMSVKINGIVRLTASDPFNVSAKKHGIGSYGKLATARWEDFFVEAV